ALRGAEAALRIHDLRVAWVRELVPEVPGERDAEGDARDREDDAADCRRTLDARASRGSDAAAAHDERRAADGARERHDDEREDPAVVRSHVPGLAVVRDSGQRERDP